MPGKEQQERAALHQEADGRMLQKVLKKVGPVLRFSEHLSAEQGEGMFRHACAMGLEGLFEQAVPNRGRDPLASFVDELHWEDPAMIRWERQEDGGWQGFSGELLVATVTKDESAEREQWLWSITALKRPKGWRKGAGHRTSWIDARRAAEEYWAKWLEQAALRADVMQLASRSLAKERKARPRKKAES
jgi:hypothetical protein